MNTEKELIDKLIGEFNQILSFEENSEAKKNWHTITKDLKPIICDTKVGMNWEKGISVDCKFTKGGNENIFPCLVNGIANEHKSHILNFLVEQKPQYFYFNPKFIMNDAEHLYCRFSIEIKKK